MKRIRRCVWESERGLRNLWMCEPLCAGNDDRVWLALVFKGGALKRWGGFKGNAAVHVTNTLVCHVPEPRMLGKTATPSASLCLSLSPSSISCSSPPSPSLRAPLHPPESVCSPSASPHPPFLFSVTTLLHLFIYFLEKEIFHLAFNVTLTIHIPFRPAIVRHGV